MLVNLVKRAHVGKDWDTFDKEMALEGSLGIFSSVFNVLFYALSITYISLHPSIPKSTVIISTLSAWLVGYIVSAFSGAKTSKEKKLALWFGTVGMPGLFASLILANTIRLLYFVFAIPIGGLLKFHDILVRLQELIAGDAIKQVKSWAETKKALKTKKRMEKEQARIRAELAKVGGAYRAPCPSCKECGQELPLYLEETKKEMSI